MAPQHRPCALRCAPECGSSGTAAGPKPHLHLRGQGRQLREHVALQPQHLHVILHVPQPQVRRHERPLGHAGPREVGGGGQAGQIGAEVLPLGVGQVLRRGERRGVVRHGPRRDLHELHGPVRQRAARGPERRRPAQGGRAPRGRRPPGDAGALRGGGRAHDGGAARGRRRGAGADFGAGRRPRGRGAVGRDAHLAGRGRPRAAPLGQGRPGGSLAGGPPDRYGGGITSVRDPRGRGRGSPGGNGGFARGLRRRGVPGVAGAQGRRARQGERGRARGRTRALGAGLTLAGLCDRDPNARCGQGAGRLRLRGRPGRLGAHASRRSGQAYASQQPPFWGRGGRGMERGVGRSRYAGAMSPGLVSRAVAGQEKAFMEHRRMQSARHYNDTVTTAPVWRPRSRLPPPPPVSSER